MMMMMIMMEYIQLQLTPTHVCTPMVFLRRYALPTYLSGMHKAGARDTKTPRRDNMPTKGP
jgi:hypothetical protein